MRHNARPLSGFFFARFHADPLAFADQAEIYTAPIEVNPAHLHPYTGAHSIADTGSFASEFLAGLIKAVILAAKLGDVHQALDIHGIQSHEDAKAGHRAHHAAVLFAKVFAHVFAFEPGLHITACLVGPALIRAAVHTGCLPGLHVSAGLLWFLTGLV